MAQIAIGKTRGAECSETEWQLKLLHTSYDEHPDMAHYAALSPDRASDIQVSCSS